MNTPLDPCAWYAGKTALVTGATSGIGREIALALAACGARVAASGRDAAALEALAAELAAQPGFAPSAPGQLSLVQADLGQEEGVAALLALAEAPGQPVDVLVNCAGFNFFGPYEKMSAPEVAAMCQVNAVSAARLCHAFLPGMLARRRGGILNVASVASFFPTPGSTLYGATKRFMLGLTDGLHAETAGTGVNVCGLYPGNTRTAFVARATAGRVGNWIKGMDPAHVARTGLAGLACGKARVYPCLGDRLRALASGLLPMGFICRRTHGHAKRLAAPGAYT